MSESVVPTVLVIGAGGHAKVVVSVLQDLGVRVAGVLDDAEWPAGYEVLGVPVLGAISTLDEYPDWPAVIAIGENRIRRQIAERFTSRRWFSAVHPGAEVHRSAELGPGTVVFAGAVIQAGTTVGAHAIINTAASVDHDCTIGDFVHVAPGARLAGGVEVGREALVGMGSAVLPGVAIGSGATLGAGAVALRAVPAGATYVGVPGRALKHS